MSRRALIGGSRTYGPRASFKSVGNADGITTESYNRITINGEIPLASVLFAR